MISVYTEEAYRYEAEELIKLFFPEKTFVFVSDPSCFTEGVLLQCGTEPSGNEWVVEARLITQNETLYHETMLISNTSDSPYRELKTPLKILIYRVLSQYTGKTLPWGTLTGIRPAKIVHKLMNEGKTQEEINDKLTSYYQLSGKKAKLLMEVARNGREYLKESKYAVSLYIGIPFCTSRCLYCSFPSFSIKEYGRMVTDYLKALKKEAEWAAEWIGRNGLYIDTIYIGGGTPTALSENDLDSLLNGILPVLPMDRIREYSVEAGRPDTVNREKFRIIQKAGATRISINPQTMQDKTLRIIGRNHTSQQIIDAFLMAREEGFHNINMDLIAGLPGETLNDFLYTLDRIGEMNPENLTVHTMSVKRASRLKEEKSSFPFTDDDTVSGMIEKAGNFTREMGMKPYYLYRQKNILANLENVGYSKPGFEGIYNILIIEEVQNILALGAGGISKILYPGNRIERIFNLKNVEQYIHRIDEMIDRKAKNAIT